MSGKRNRESDLSSDDESGVEEIAEFSNKRTRKNTSSFKGASFLREEQFQAEMKDNMYFLVKELGLLALITFLPLSD